jgi:hypothetical protein
MKDVLEKVTYMAADFCSGEIVISTFSVDLKNSFEV